MKRLPRYLRQHGLRFADKMSKITKVVEMNNSKHNVQIAISTTNYVAKSIIVKPFVHRSYVRTSGSPLTAYSFYSKCDY